MSEPVSSRSLRFVYNSLLLTTAGLTARKLTPGEHPFGFAACMVGGAAAVLGLLRVLFAGDDTGGEDMSNRVLPDVCQGMLELVPLPLVNMELYMRSIGLGTVVWAHGIFLLPLLLDIRCSLRKNRKNCDLTETLRDLSILSNIVSLGFLAIAERDFLYMRMTLTVMLVRYYPVLMDSAQDETGEDLIVCGTALLFYFLGKAHLQLG